MSRALAAGLLALGLAARAGAEPPGPPLAAPDPAVPPPLAATGFVTADQQIKDGETWIGRGLVDIRWRDVVIQADYAELNERTKDLLAEGNVVLQEGDRRIAGERIEFNLETKTGKLWKVWGYSDQEVYFTAREVSKESEDRYSLKRPTVTSCNQPNPIWQLKASSGTYKTDSYVRLWNVRLEIKGVPLLYFPFFQYPAKRERATGFLFPSIGTNNRRGFYIANSFFWALGRSADATFTHEWYKDRGNLVRSEWTWVPTERGRGTLLTENLFDTKDDRRSGRYVLRHQQGFGRGWQVGIDAQYATDERLEREFNNSFSVLTQRTRSSEGYLSRNWSRWSVSLGARHRKTFGTSESTDFSLPGFEAALRDSRLLGPLYGRAAVRAANLGVDSLGQELRWQRAEVDPGISLALAPFPWLQLRPQATYRLSWYSKSFKPDTNRRERSEEPFLRRYFYAKVGLTGPIFTAVWHTEGNFYSDKYKHVVEPVVEYQYTSDFDPHAQAILYGSDQPVRINQIAFFLRNHFLAKRSLTPGGLLSPYEFLSIDLGLAYSLDPKLGTVADGRNLTGLLSSQAAERRGPLFATLNFKPTQNVLVSYRAALDTVRSFWPSHSVQATFRGEGFHLDASYSRNRNKDQVTSEQLRGQTGFALFRGKIELAGAASYNVKDAILYELRTNAIFHTQCCGVGFGWIRRRIGLVNDSEYRFSVSFKNVGTVFDYTLGDSQL